MLVVATATVTSLVLAVVSGSTTCINQVYMMLCWMSVGVDRINAFSDSDCNIRAQMWMHMCVCGSMHLCAWVWYATLSCLHVGVISVVVGDFPYHYGQSVSLRSDGLHPVRVWHGWGCGQTWGLPGIAWRRRKVSRRWTMSSGRCDTYLLPSSISCTADVGRHLLCVAPVSIYWSGHFPGFVISLCQKDSIYN